MMNSKNGVRKTKKGTVSRMSDQARRPGQTGGSSHPKRRKDSVVSSRHTKPDVSKKRRVSDKNCSVKRLSASAVPDAGSDELSDHELLSAASDEGDHDVLKFIGNSDDEEDASMAENRSSFSEDAEDDSEEDENVNYRTLGKSSTSASKHEDGAGMRSDSDDEECHQNQDNASDVDDGLEADNPEIVFTGDLSVVKERIAENAAKLANWRTETEKKAGKEQVSRATVVQQLVQDVSTYYGYSLELAGYFVQLMNSIEVVSFFEAVDAPRPVTLRTNMLNTRRRDLAKVLISRGCNVDPIGDWSKVGLKVIESSVPIGATPEYCAGQYMLQSASSFLPVMALAPQPGELVLDMAAAPGGKSTYIGQLMKNSGVLFCNEINKERTTALVANIHRMGVTNTVVLNMDGADLVGKLPPLDRVLLDAPCTGLGVISRDPSVKVKRTLKDFKDQAAIQKKLLAAAVDVCNANSATGGYIVYSTCSLSVEENEEVIDYILKARGVKVVPLGIPEELGSPGLTNYREHRFHPSIKNARRVYPHLHNMDGFFVCKLKKTSDDVPKREKKDRRKHNAYVMNWGPEHWKPELLNKPIEFPTA